MISKFTNLTQREIQLTAGLMLIVGGLLKLMG